MKSKICTITNNICTILRTKIVISLFLVKKKDKMFPTINPLEVINGKYRKMINHPPCTQLFPIILQCGVIRFLSSWIALKWHL